MFFHLFIDIVGEVLFESVYTLVQIIVGNTGGIAAYCIDGLADKFIQQVRNFVVVYIVEVDKRCYELFNGRTLGATRFPCENLEVGGISKTLTDNLAA